MNNYDGIATSLDTLITCSLDHAQTWERERENMGTLRFNMRFRTLDLRFGAATGKTNYLMSRATPRTLILVHSISMARAYVDRTQGYVMYWGELRNDFRLDPFDRVFVDEPLLQEGIKTERVDYLWAHDMQLFLFLGSL